MKPAPLLASRRIFRPKLSLSIQVKSERPILAPIFGPKTPRFWCAKSPVREAARGVCLDLDEAADP